MHSTRKSKGWPKDALVALAFGCITFLFYLPMLLGRQTLPAGDFTEQFLLFQVHGRSELLAGRIPLWNPYNHSGHPFLADVQTALFYPINLLVIGLGAASTTLASALYWIQVEVVLQVALAGFFMYLFVRDITGRRGAGLLSGVAFAYSGYLMGYPVLQLSVLRTVIWLPLVLWALWRAFHDGARWRWWFAGALAYAIALLGGHSQSFFLASHMVAGWLVVGFWLGRTPAQPIRTFPPYVLRVFAFYLLTAALSAVQILPAIEYVALSNRASSTFAFLAGGLPLAGTWQLIVPGTLTYFSPLYAGIIPLALALLAVGHARTRRGVAWDDRDAPFDPAQRAIVFYMLGAALLFLAISYSEQGFIYPLLYRWVPGWDLFRGQERAIYLVVFSLCVLAGLGASRVPYLSTRAATRWGAGLAALLLTAVALYAIGWQLTGRTVVTHETFARQAAPLLLWLGALAALLRYRRHPYALWLAALVVVADLAWSGVSTNLEAFTPAQRVAWSPEASLMWESARAPDEDHQGLPPRAYNVERAHGNYGLEVRVEDLGGTSPLKLARYAALLEPSFPIERTWQLTGTRYVLTWAPYLALQATLVGEIPRESDTSRLFRLDSPFPRVWVVPQVVVAEDSDALRLLADYAFNPERQALIAAPAAAPPLTGETSASAITVERHAPAHMTLHVQSDRAGWLVISENWMPGWRAWRIEANGERTALPVTRTNLTFLGTMVPSGESVIEVRYLPTSFVVGAAVSSLALLALLAGTITMLRRSSSEERAE